jgi:photosystem II stability/assembly factor-like uncharacterized protein
MSKYTILVCMMDLFTFSFAAWESIGPDGGYIRSIVVSSTDSDLIYGATYYSPSKIIMSTDAGDSWIQVGSYPDINYCMAIDPTDDNKLYAGSFGRIYCSIDKGMTWSPSNLLANTYCYGLVVDPINPNTIYGAGTEYISSGNYDMVFLKSTDSGMNWTITSILSTGFNYGWCIAVDPIDPDIIYVGGCGYTSTREPRIFKSTDAGISWDEIYTAANGYYVYSLAINPGNTDIIYAGTYTDGIYRTTDAGNSWTKVHTGYYYYRMATSPADPNIVFSSGYYYVYRSTDQGLSWSTVITGLPVIAYYYGLAINQLDASEIYLGSSAGFFKSTNTGTDWFDSSSGLHLSDIISMGIAPSAASTMYVTSENVAVYKTTNNGDDWTRLPSFSDCGDINAFAIHNTDPDTVIALEGYG